jgi:ubiquinone/menaquinone biosynthesis C-methylase UbiE
MTIHLAHNAERLFSGPLAEEYEMLKLICPAAAEMSRLVGEFVAHWNTSALSEPFNILELGCGTGVTTLHLLNSGRNATLTALDNEPAMLNQARTSLVEALKEGRLHLVENDAWSYLRETPAQSFDIVASAYTLHNFLNGYRDSVLEEIHRVLKPGGLFINGDRYALDDTVAHLHSLQEEVRHYFSTFRSIDRLDLLEQWILHLFSDESPHHVMRLEPALEKMRRIGFALVTIHYRHEVNALVAGVKAWQ